MGRAAVTNKVPSRRRADLDFPDYDRVVGGWWRPGRSRSKKQLLMVKEGGIQLVYV